MDVWNSVSTAYWWQRMLNVEMRRLIGDTMMEKRSGQRTEPYGTVNSRWTEVANGDTTGLTGYVWFQSANDLIVNWLNMAFVLWSIVHEYFNSLLGCMCWWRPTIQLILADEVAQCRLREPLSTNPQFTVNNVDSFWLCMIKQSSRRPIYELVESLLTLFITLVPLPTHTIRYNFTRCGCSLTSWPGQWPVWQFTLVHTTTLLS